MGINNRKLARDTITITIIYLYNFIHQFFFSVVLLASVAFKLTLVISVLLIYFGVL